MDITHPVDQNILTIHPRRLRARQESHSGGNLFRSADSLAGVQARDELDLLLGLALAEEGRVNWARRDGVDGDAACTEILRKDTGNLLDRALGGDVDERVG